MSEVTLSATLKANSFLATVTVSNGVALSSAETFPTIREAITAPLPEAPADTRADRVAGGRRTLVRHRKGRTP